MTVELDLHAEPYTVDDVLRLFDENLWVELLEGALIVSPSPRRRHQRAGYRLCRALDDAAPAGVQVLPAFNVRPDPGEPTLFIPDVVVTTVNVEDADSVMLEAADVLAVVEVVSPSSGSYDRLLKPARDAAAGIGCYWRVELDPFPGYDGPLPVVLCHELVDGVYRESARLVAGTSGHAALPFPVTFDPADLLR